MGCGGSGSVESSCCGSGEVGELAGLACDGGGRRKARSGPFGISVPFLDAGES